MSMDKILFTAITVFVYFKEVDTRGLSEDGRLNFVQLGEKYGFPVEAYKVTTEDGYILTLFRIRGSEKAPVLLMHGLCDSADTWIIRGNTSLAVVLAGKGHDVWAGNVRGNKYSRGHVRLDPNKDGEYWDASFHEYGYYDLPAIIDTVLENTGAHKLKAIGHSQGNTLFFVLGSTRPEYNDKVELVVALAPICYLQNVQRPLRAIIQLVAELNELAHLRQLFSEKSALLTIWRSICPQPIVGYALCVQSVIFQLSGYDTAELEADFAPTVVGHFPSSCSAKSINHYSQVLSRRKFARYDYGREANIDVYNATEPPEYDLNRVETKIALLVGANDRLATLDDVAILRRKLPNVVRYMVIPWRRMNHNDFIWGRRMVEYLFPYIFDLL